MALFFSLIFLFQEKEKKSEPLSCQAVNPLMAISMKEEKKLTINHIILHQKKIDCFFSFFHTAINNLWKSRDLIFSLIHFSFSNNKRKEYVGSNDRTIRKRRNKGPIASNILFFI